MRATILYPFRIDSKFEVGYAWSAELARRLKVRLALFTTLAPTAKEPVADIYHALASAQGFYIKHFQLLPLRLSPIKTDRHLMEGEFEGTFNSFIQQNPPYIMVLQSDFLSSNQIKVLIQSGCKVIVLPAIDLFSSLEMPKDRSQLFISILGKAALYNIPTSFFTTISKDRNLFNAITRFFKK